MQSVRLRVRKRGVLILPKELRERLGFTEGSLLEAEAKGTELRLRKQDLWAKMWGASRGLITPEEAEAEFDEAER